MLIGGTVEMHLLTERLPVFWKQREMRFYPGERSRANLHHMPAVDCFATVLPACW
jgi:hypothetical protein